MTAIFRGGGLRNSEKRRPKRHCETEILRAMPEQAMTRDRVMTHVRFAVDGYVLGKWSLWQAGAQICEALETYYRQHPHELSPRV